MTGAPELRIINRRFLLGCSDRLAERTALVEIAVPDHVVFDDAAETRIRAGIAALHPEEPLLRTTDNDWPDSFLVAGPPDQPGDPVMQRLGRWLVAVTITIQRFAREPVFRGRVSRCDPQRLTLALPWYREAVFNESLTLALQLVGQWVGIGSAKAAEPTLSGHFGERWMGIRNGGVAPYTLSFIQAGALRGIPFSVLPSCVQLGWGANAERFDMSFSTETSWMANSLAKNKAKTSRTLAAAFLPVPDSRVVSDVEAAERVANQLGWPVVIKPLSQELGSGVVAGIPDAATLRQTFGRAAKYSPGNVVIENHIDGDDHRMLVVNGRMLMAVRRVPAGVTGDGVHTVAQLVEAANTDPRRGTHRYSLLKKLVFDDEAASCLAEHGNTKESVPRSGQWVPLRRIANISSGGTAEDVTASVHPDNVAMAERAARIVGLNIAGIDFLTTDISRSWRDIGGAICEVNAQPGFSPHWLAAPERDMEGEVLDLLFAERSALIPTAAITGATGTGMAARMLGEIWRAAGRLTGICTTSELRIGEEVLTTQNRSGYPGTRIILEDPGVQAAVLEMPGAGLASTGHPCDRYDVAAVLDASDQLEAEVLQRAELAVVINADDPRCLALRSHAGTARHILVAREPDCPAVVEHRRSGGESVFIAGRDGRRWVVLAEGERELALMPVDEIPGANNAQRCSSSMFAAALAWAQGIEIAVIRKALGGRQVS